MGIYIITVIFKNKKLLQVHILVVCRKKHFPLLPTEKKATPTKPCQVCFLQKKRKEIRYVCEMCPRKPALCLGVLLKINGGPHDTNNHLKD